MLSRPIFLAISMLIIGVSTDSHETHYENPYAEGVSEMVSIIRDFDDLAANIASPPPDRPVARAVGNFGRRVCDAVARNPEIYAPTFLQWPILAVCQPYFDGGNIDPPVPVVPFNGGQCPVVYSVSGTYSLIDPDSGNVAIPNQSYGPVSILGPIEGFVNDVVGPDFRLLIRGANGSQSEIVRSPTFRPRGDTINATRQDGLSDDCGDPDPTFEPGANPPPNSEPPPPGTGPVFDIRGNPVFVLPPTLNVEPNIDITVPVGEVNLGSGTGNTPPSAPVGGDPVEGEGSGSGGGDTDFGEAPPGERWIGCCVNITARPVGHGEIPQSVPETIYPDIIGNVRLKFISTFQTAEYDTPLINKQKTTCVWEPVRGLQPIGVRVNLRPGFSYSVTPYSVPLEN